MRGTTYRLSLLISLVTLIPGIVFASKISYSPSHWIVGHDLSTGTVASSSIVDFGFSFQKTSTTTSPSSGTFNYRDILFSLYSGATTVVGAQLSVTQPIGNTSQTTCVSLDTTIAKVASDCSAVYGGGTNGNAGINVSIPGLTKQVMPEFSTTTVGYQVTPTSIIAGTAASSLLNSTLAYINGKSPGAATQAIYSSIDDTHHVYVRNTSNFLTSAGVDLTCIPSGNGGMFNGILIGPDIMLEANHAHNNTFYFTDASNVSYFRSSIGGARVLDYDTYIERLNAPVPASIHPCPLFSFGELASTTAHFSTSSLQSEFIPVMFHRQTRNIYIGGVYIGNGSCTFTPGSCYDSSYDEDHVNVFKPASTTLATWWSLPIVGDSGSPAFAIVNGKAVAMTTWFQSDFLSRAIGPSASLLLPYIQNTVTALGSSATIQTVDLSGFPSY